MKLRCSSSVQWTMSGMSLQEKQGLRIRIRVSAWRAKCDGGALELGGVDNIRDETAGERGFTNRFGFVLGRLSPETWWSSWWTTLGKDAGEKVLIQGLRDGSEPGKKTCRSLEGETMEAVECSISVQWTMPGVRLQAR
jgi:hypothetical protein